MVAGPYTANAATAEERVANLGAMNRAAVALFDRGWTPVIGVNMALPVIAAAGEARFDDIMAPISLSLAARCDAVLRIGGPSTGADAELDLIRKQGGAVYFQLEDVPPAP